MKKITELRVLENYQLQLWFDDGVTGQVDFSNKPHTGVYAPWRNYEYFCRAKIDADGQLAWDDQLDFSADSLWFQVTGRQPEETKAERDSECSSANA